MFKRLSALLFLSLIWAGAARADVIVLMHGYQSSVSAWSQTGIDRELARAGWRFGGRLFDSRGTVALDGPGADGYENSFYSVSLPQESMLWTQTDFLAAYLTTLRAWHPKERFILVGHSAGGVVARLYMVRHPEAPIQALITIASPHLGSDAADVAGFVGSTPLAMMAPMVGLGTLNRSQGLYHDLSADRPDSVLYWLNRQTHPVAQYISVVRRNGDLLIAEHSQDMRNVPMLQNRARSVQSGEGHGLQASDGPLLVRLIKDLGRRQLI